jgi:hypothetical protein
VAQKGRGFREGTPGLAISSSFRQPLVDFLINIQLQRAFGHWSLEHYPVNVGGGGGSVRFWD